MNTRKLISTITATVLMAAFVLIATETSNAQGRYTNRYSKRDVSNLISRLETNSDRFRRDFDRAMDNSRLNGTSDETRFNNLVRDFENSVDRLRREFDRNDTWWNTRNDVEDMIRDASPVNTMINTLPFRRNIERQWTNLRNSINTVADTYDLSGLNGGGWNGGGVSPGWGGGGSPVTPPSWAQGTFYGTAPNGSRITLTIDRNGSVTADIDGSPNYGSFTRGNNLYINGATSRVSRQGNGFRTVSNQDGETIAYTRGGWNRGDGDRGDVPNWAIGSFQGRNPQDGSVIILNISRDGSVTVNMGNSTNYGSLNGTRLTINGASSTISRRNDGLRTVSDGDGQTINYIRN